MYHLRQIFTGVALAFLLLSIIIGAFAITLSEEGTQFAFVEQITSSPTITEVLLLTTSPLPTNTLRGISPTPSSLPTSVTSLVQSTNTPSVLPPTNCPPPSGWVPIMIEEGDTLVTVATNFNTTPEQLAASNCLLVDTLIPGSILYVPYQTPTNTPTIKISCGPPGGWILYTVQDDDNLFRLSIAFRVSVSSLQFANCLGSNTLIREGQRIWVPNVPTSTPIISPTNTPRPATSTSKPTNTAPIPPTGTPTASSTPTSPLLPTITRSPTPMPSSPTASATQVLTPTQTPIPTETNTSTPTTTPSPTTPSPTSSFTPTPTVDQSTATFTPSPQTFLEPNPSDTPTPTETTNEK